MNIIIIFTYLYISIKICENSNILSHIIIHYNHNLHSNASTILLHVHLPYLYVHFHLYFVIVMNFRFIISIIIRINFIHFDSIPFL